MRDRFNLLVPRPVPEPKDFLDREAVARRAAAFPRIAALLGESLEEFLTGARRQRVRSGPRLIDILERTGEASGRFLDWVSRSLARLDDVAPGGWATWQARFGRARLNAFGSFVSELAVMVWALDNDIALVAVDPPSNAGRRADLLLAGRAGEFAVEVSTPTNAEWDWVERAIDELFERLSRVPTGLYVDIEGYAALRMLDSGRWEPLPRVGSQGVSDVLSAFRREAALFDRARLPVTLVEPSDEQPLRIIAREWDPRVADSTEIIAGWDRSGIAPDVERLAEKITAERAQLPLDRPGAIFIDLQSMQDFRHADYYLRRVAERLRQRSSLPAFIGTCLVWVHTADVLIERTVLHADQEVPVATELAALWSA